MDLVEDAIHLLRRTPVAIHLIYHIASASFVLGLLWFWSDMTRGAYADGRVAPGALLLSGLYLAMKTGQAAFCARLRQAVSHQRPTPWTFGRCWRLLLTQAALQPLGFLLFPLSIFPLLMIPLPWFLAFFQGVSVSGDGAQGSVSRCARAAFRQALLWPGQNHGIVGLLVVCTTAVFLDVTVGVGALPFLAKTLFGITTDFNLSIHAYLNTTFVLSLLALTYLVMDPVIKAIYVLRTFQADSIQSGDDLRSKFAELRQDRLVAGSSALLLALLLCCNTGGTNARAQEPAPSSPPTPITTPQRTVEPERLGASIKEVMDGVEYTWRGPRELSPEEPERPGESRILRWIRKQLRSIGEFTSRNLESFFRSLGRLIQRVLSGFNPPAMPTGNSQVDWATGLQFVLYALLAAGIGGVGWLLFKLWRGRRPDPAPAVAVPLAGTPDLRAETVSADQLPEDGWLSLAAEMAAKAEWRLALRAVYLASLAHLAQRELVRLAPSKSNYEYQMELRRRARALPAIQSAFSETVNDFDRVWYGSHAATPTHFDQVRSRLETMRTTTPAS